MTPPPYPIPGRCAACLHRAEQHPSGNWRHLTRPCRFRSVTIVQAGQLPMPKAVFVPDDEPLPRPDSNWQTTVNYENGVPTSMNVHSPEQVAAFWDEVREALHDGRHA